MNEVPREDREIMQEIEALNIHSGDIAVLLDTVEVGILAGKLDAYDGIDTDAQTALKQLRQRIAQLEAERDGWRNHAVAMRETLQGIMDKHHVDEALPGRGGENIDEVIADYVDYLKQS